MDYYRGMLSRNTYADRVRSALDRSPVVALLGPRQCGKTTLARSVVTDPEKIYFDLENPQDQARLAHPILQLEQMKGLVVLDEIQRAPQLLEALRVLVDRPNNTARYLLLGSASPHLVKSSSESLAGRIAFVDLFGFNTSEIQDATPASLWLRGGFPRSFLAKNDDESMEWRNDFIRTFLERDIPQLGITIPSDTLRRFWTMLAHYHGQIWNAAEFARALGSAEATARRYLDIMTGSYMVRQLHPWHENLKKRQVRAPKIYIRDTGILHALLGLPDVHTLSGHPKNGASWEGFVIEQIISLANTRDAYFWATHQGAELDLLLFTKGKRIGFEVKFTESPTTTKSMRIAVKDLHIDKLFVVHPGDASYPLDTGIEALSITDIVRTGSSMIGGGQETRPPM